MSNNTQQVPEKELKRRFQLWLKPSVLNMAEQLYESDNCISKSEFIEKAIMFYAGYLFSEGSGDYLPKIITSTLKGIVNESDIGPGICTNSARFVYDLGQITGDKRWTDLYWRIKAAAINCTSTYDGEFCGKTFDKNFAKGMLSEQINMTNSLNAAGETWRVSASWPSTAVLLGWFDSSEDEIVGG